MPYAIPGTILIYTIAAFAGAPQWMLHGGSVLAFGPIFGSFMAWISTMVSASIDFWLGRRLGAERVGKFGGKIVDKFISIIRKHGFWTSLTVRVVPSGPFVVINKATGDSWMLGRRNATNRPSELEAGCYLPMTIPQVVNAF